MLGCFNPILGQIWTNPAIGLHFISIVTLDVLLIISNFSTTCQVTLIRVLVYYSRLSVDC